MSEYKIAPNNLTSEEAPTNNGQKTKENKSDVYNFDKGPNQAPKAKSASGSRKTSEQVIIVNNDTKSVKSMDRKSYKKLKEVKSIKEEDAQKMATWTTEQRKAEIKRLKSLINSYRVLMLMVSLNSGWLLYINNINIFYIRSVLKIGGAVLNQFLANASLPWMVKPLWGFCSDSFFIFGYRFKLHMILMTLITISSASLLIVYPEPDFYLYTGINVMINFSTAYIDTMAEGLSAILTKYFDQIKVLEALDMKEGEEAEDNSMTAYGNYNGLRSLFRVLMSFIGGLAAERTNLRTTGIVLGSYPIIFLVYLVVFFKEEKKKVFFAGCSHFKKGFYFTFKALLYPVVIFPLLFNLLPSFLPSPDIYYIYMMLGRGGWSFDEYVINGFVTGLLRSFALIWFVNAVKNLSFVNLQLYGQIISAACILSFSVALYCQYFSVLSFSIVWLFINMLYTFGSNMMMVSLVGRISKYLPEGFESTGVTIIISGFAVAFTVNKYVSTPFLEQFDIEPGYYDRVEAPQVFWIISRTLFVLLSPLFLMWG